MAPNKSLAAPESPSKLIALGVVLPSLALLFASLRIWARRRTHTTLGIDDYLVVLAVVLVWGLGITQIIASTEGNLGQPIGETPQGAPILDHRTRIFQQNEYAFQVIEKITFGLIKLSILYFYRRIFVGRNFNIVSWSMIVLIFAWMLSFFLATACECIPPSLLWSGNRQAQLNQCIKTVTMLLAFAWTDVITDAIILCIPLALVGRLQMPLKRKAALWGIFMLGFLTVVAGVARLIFFYRAAQDHLGADIAINTAPTIYWSLVEAAMAITSACLPTLRPLFRGWFSENVLGSLRSKISMKSVLKITAPGSKNSKGSDGSKKSKGLNSTYLGIVKPAATDRDAASSQIELRDIEDGFCGSDENPIQTIITGNPSTVERRQMSEENHDGIVVSKSFVTEEEHF